MDGADLKRPCIRKQHAPDMAAREDAETDEVRATAGSRMSGAIQQGKVPLSVGSHWDAMG